VSACFIEGGRGALAKLLQLQGELHCKLPGSIRLACSTSFFGLGSKLLDRLGAKDARAALKLVHACFMGTERSQVFMHRGHREASKLVQKAFEHGSEKTDVIAQALPHVGRVNAIDLRPRYGRPRPTIRGILDQHWGLGPLTGEQISLSSVRRVSAALYVFTSVVMPGASVAIRGKLALLNFTLRGTGMRRGSSRSLCRGSWPGGHLLALRS
jgi:hypothetical protein